MSKLTIKYGLNFLGVTHRIWRIIFAYLHRIWRIIFAYLLWYSRPMFYLTIIRCSMAFQTLPELRRHKNIAHSPKRYKCEVTGCNLAFTRFREFRKHRTASHPELFVYSCSHCEQVFNSKTQLGKHAVSHKKKHRCEAPGCLKAFSTKYNLKTHVEIVSHAHMPWHFLQNFRLDFIVFLN